MGGDFNSSDICRVNSLQEWLKFDFSELEGKGFVIKANHGSGMNKIYKKGDSLSERDRHEIASWFNFPSHLNSREFHYKHISKKVFIEELLGDNLNDYKIHSFDNKNQFLQVDYDRFERHTRNIYDSEGELLDLEINYSRNLSMNINMELIKPVFVLANNIREELGFKYVRVDFYLKENQI